jgi:PilZ domain
VQITGSDDTVECSGVISGFSRTGITVKTPSAIRRGSEIKIVWEKASVSGKVRYCRRRAPKTFHVGVKITEIVNAQGAPISPVVA